MTIKINIKLINKSSKIENLKKTGFTAQTFKESYARLFKDLLTSVFGGTYANQVFIEVEDDV